MAHFSAEAAKTKALILGPVRARARACVRVPLYCNAPHLAHRSQHWNEELQTFAVISPGGGGVPASDPTPEAGCNLSAVRVPNATAGVSLSLSLARAYIYACDASGLLRIVTNRIAHISHHHMRDNIVYCNVMQCIELYCIVLYCIVFMCAGP